MAALAAPIILSDLSQEGDKSIIKSNVRKTGKGASTVLLGCCICVSCCCAVLLIAVIIIVVTSVT